MFAVTFERAQLAAAALAIVLLFAVVPHTLAGDGHARYEGLTNFGRTGELRDMRYSYVGPLAAAPFLLFDARSTQAWWISRFNVLVLAAGAVAAWGLLRGALPAMARASFIVLLVAGGMMPYHVRDFYGEVFTATCVSIGLLAVVARRRWWGWIPVVVGVANTPATIVGLGFVAVWRLIRARRYDGLVSLACAAGVVLGENLLVRGDVLANGYTGDHGVRTVMPFSGRPGFSYPLLFGALSLLFSFGKGVLFFAPGVILIRHARRVVAPAVADLLDAWSLFAAGILIVFAQWWSWYGGWYWGPRFLLAAVFPSALALALALTGPASHGRRAAAAALGAWTFWVGVSGVAFPDHGLDLCMADNYALEHLCWYAPEFSPLFRPLVIGAPARELWQRAWILLAIASAAAVALPAVTTSLKRSAPPPSS